MKVKKLTETAVVPQIATEGSAGFDLCVDKAEDTMIFPGQTIKFPTGLAFAIPQGYAGLIFARSGTAVKRGLRPSTCVSVIDSDYRGEVGLPVYNDSDKSQTIHPYERVAQMVIVPVFTPEIEIVDELDNTERGSAGFGSTGR